MEVGMEVGRGWVWRWGVKVGCVRRVVEVGVKVGCVRLGGRGGLKVRCARAGDGGGYGGEVCDGGGYGGKVCEGWFVVVAGPTLAVRGQWKMVINCFCRQQAIKNWVVGRPGSTEW